MSKKSDFEKIETAKSTKLMADYKDPEAELLSTTSVEMANLNVEGIIVTGTVISRSRRYFENGNKYRFTYVILSNGFKHTVHIWGEHIAYGIGQIVRIPVYIKVYAGKNNRLGYTLEMSTNSDLEETF
jgi:hypothetical protein